MWKIRNKSSTRQGQQVSNQQSHLEVSPPQAGSPRFNYKACICGVGRNLSPYFKTTTRNILKIANSFAESKVIIVESDSSDDTVKLFSSVPEITFRSMGNLQSKYPLRTDRIAQCRNVYLDYVMKECPHYDIMIVIDLDDVLSEDFNLDILSSCLCDEHYPRWDVVFANQSYRYYDIWALRSAEVDYDCWDKVNRGEMDKIDAIFKHQTHIPRNSDAIPVVSAFGGLGIYKIKHLDENCKYIGTSESTLAKEICEHVPLNTYLSTKGLKLFIDPTMVLTTPSSFAKYYV